MVLWIVEEGLEGNSSTRDLWALYHFSRELDRMCADAGVTKLSKFHDNSVMAAEFDQVLEQKLSDPSELLTTLTSVRPLVMSGTTQFVEDGKDHSGELRQDLDEAIRVAAECKAKGKRVRLSVIP